MITASTARIARDAGMQQALDHAQDLCSDWSKRAYAFLVEYAQNNEFFCSEEVSAASKTVPSFPQPKDDRSWGSTYSSAARDGIIRPHSTTRRARGHSSIGILWRSLVFIGTPA